MKSKKRIKRKQKKVMPKEKNTRFFIVYPLYQYEKRFIGKKDWRIV